MTRVRTLIAWQGKSEECDHRMFNRLPQTQSLSDSNKLTLTQSVSLSRPKLVLYARLYAVCDLIYTRKIPNHINGGTTKKGKKCKDIVLLFTNSIFL